MPVQIKVSSTNFDSPIFPHAATPVYGTGAYDEYVIKDDGELFYSYNKCGKTVFTIVDNLETSIMDVTVFNNGDKIAVGALVKAEVEHFEEEVELTII